MAARQHALKIEGRMETNYAICSGLIHMYIADLQNCVPMAVSNLGHKALDGVHSVKSDGSLLLECGQRPCQVVLFQVLLYQSDHTGRGRGERGRARGWGRERESKGGGGGGERQRERYRVRERKRGREREGERGRERQRD